MKNVHFIDILRQNEMCSSEVNEKLREEPQKNQQNSYISVKSMFCVHI